MSTKRKIVHDFFYYFLDMIFVSLIGYTFYFLMGRYLVPTEYGILMTVIGIFTVLSPLTSLGFNEALARFVPILGKEKYYILKYSIKKSLSVSLIVAFLFFIFSDVISNYLYSNESISFILKIFGVLLVSGNVFIISKGFLQGRKDFKSMLLFDFFSQPLRILIPFLFIGVIGGVISGLTGWSLCFIVFSFLVYFKIGRKVSEDKIPKKFLRYGILSMLALSGYWFFIQFPVVFLSAFSLEESGYMGVAVVFAQIILFIFLITSGTILPHLSDFYKKKQMNKARKLLKVSLVQSILTSIVIYVLIYFFSEKILLVLYSYKYLPALGYIKKFLVTSILFGVNWIFMTDMYSKGYPEKRSVYIWTANIITVIGSFILFGIFGVNGILISLIVSQIFLLAINIRYSIWQ